MNKVKVLCINDSNKPNEIPSNLWIKKDQEYHITHIYYLLSSSTKDTGCRISRNIS